jgi:hypothetical protein
MWVKVYISGGKHFYLNLPVSLYAFEELLDCAMDLLDVASFFTPKQQVTNSSSISVHTVKALTKSLSDLMNSLVGSEPYELVNVEVENVKVSVKIG